MAHMTCTLCGREAGVKLCSRCGDVAYCGKECQILDWSFHKLTCSAKVVVGDTEDRGKGLFAKLDFKVGDEMIREAPCFVIASGISDYDRHDAFQNVSIAKKRLVMSLTDVFSARAGLMGIVNTNSISMGVDMLGVSSATGGIFPLMTRINHACKPNARYVWREDLGKELLFAIRPISKGDEITVTYIARYASRQKRQQELKQRWRFDCACVTCTELHTQLQDSCMCEIQELHDKGALIYAFKRKRKRK